MKNKKKQIQNVNHNEKNSLEHRMPTKKMGTMLPLLDSHLNEFLCMNE